MTEDSNTEEDIEVSAVNNNNNSHVEAGGGLQGIGRLAPPTVTFEAYTGNSRVRQSDIIINKCRIIGAQIVAQYQGPDPTEAGEGGPKDYWQPEIKVLLDGAQDLGLPVTDHNQELLASLGYEVDLPEIPEDGAGWMEDADDDGDQD